MTNAPLIISNYDFQSLQQLIKDSRSETIDGLEDEITKASVLPEDNVPADIVGMNSAVTIKNLATDEVSELTLVYPQNANVAENRISILAPMGTALIGLKAGQIYQWPMPNGKTKRFQVMKVVRKYRAPGLAGHTDEKTM